MYPRVNRYRGGKNKASRKQETDKHMKTITSAVLGLALSIAAFAAQTPKVVAKPASAPVAATATAQDAAKPADTKSTAKKTKKARKAKTTAAAAPKM